MRRLAAPILAAGTACLLLAGCSASAPTGAAPTASAYAAVPEPGHTIEATPPTDLAVMAGWTIAVVVPDDSAATETLRTAVAETAERNGARVEEFAAASVDAAFADAVEADADVVIGLGAGTSDVFSYEGAQWLDREFLIIGAQLAEPTANVTAVVWEGATSRGSGAPADGDLDPDGVTPERAALAAAAGLGSVSDGTTGIVLHLDG